MNYDELKDALDGFYAYDVGCLDSGIHDPKRKTQVIAYLLSLGGDERRILLSRIGRELYLSDQAIAEGCGLEDAESFYEWLQDIDWRLMV